VGAETVTIDCPAGRVEAHVAGGVRLRFLGLMGLDAEEVRPLLFPRCRSIHTWFMRTPIDLVWLELCDDEAKVLSVAPELPRRRTASAPKGAQRKRVAALELSPGAATALGIRSGSTLACQTVRAR
jgi:uncharacterized membrane protein (UPF0127 family)